MHSDLELEYRYLDEVSSTNDYLRTYESVADVTVASASCQTKGRGQMGNTWVSEPGQNLLFSVLVCPVNLEVRDAFVLSQAMALAIKDVLDAYLEDVFVKWPNDIYCRGEKICGTLIENSLSGKYVSRSVIGSGVNVNQTEFPGGLAVPATSLRLHLGRELVPAELLLSVISGFSGYYGEILNGSYRRIREQYHASLYLRGKACRFCDVDGVFSGCISHVESDGHLIIVDDSSCTRRYAFKQVKLLHADGTE